MAFKLPDNLLNNTTKPILFVSIIIILIGLFGSNIAMLDYPIQFLFIGLPISIVIFYYFGKITDGWLYLFALLLVNQAWDLVMPPYAVDPTGMINGSMYMAATSVDYFFGSILHSMGINGYTLYLSTYIGCFIILFVSGTILAKMSKRK